MASRSRLGMLAAANPFSSSKKSAESSTTSQPVGTQSKSLKDSNTGNNNSDITSQTIIKIDLPDKLENYYSFDQKIYDAGDRSKVFTAKDLHTGKEVVVKMRKKGFFTTGENAWRNMLTRMKTIQRNDNILGIQKIFEDNKAYFVIMQKCGGGELFDFLLNETDVSERECKRIMREILTAVSHLHENGLVHRDLKPENILFAGRRLSIDGVPQPEPQTEEERQKFAKQLKLIDFDTVAHFNGPDSPRAERTVGTPGYIAPESFRGDYTPASDLWSVGVILYILMTGDMPFSETVFGDDLSGNNQVGGSKMEEVYKRLNNAKIDFECAPWCDFPLAKDLCQKLLSFDPAERGENAMVVLEHPWLKDENAATGSGSSLG